jgi:hypothetical protein
MIARSRAVAIAGGHVAVLLYRMRLFGLAELLKDKPVFAWSAGAMAVSEKVVLFHDDQPHGPSHPETLDRGLGIAPGIVPLPHARKRLKLDDGARVTLFARRFSPAVCVTLDPGSRGTWNGDNWTSPGDTSRLCDDGDVRGLSA